jgi:malonyl-CoA decarboxylase
MSSGNGIKPVSLDPDLPEADVKILQKLMRECLDGKGGEVSSRARAAVLGQAYLNLNTSGRKRYLEVLAQDFAVDKQSLAEIKQKINELENNPDLVPYLRELLTPPRLKLLTQFNDLPQGVQFLVDLRSDLRSFMNTDPQLKSLEDDLKGLLESWFDVGFLELRRLTWNDPASLLEKIIEYEAVHEISSWHDLRNRLDSDRRCYAFFHPCMPEEPLIFVEIALVKGMARSIQDLLDEQAPAVNPQDADTAIFYSITNTQSGLQGIRFGSFLIKRVVDHLAGDLPRLNVFATLSPIPGLINFIKTMPEDKEQKILTDAEQSELEKITGTRSLKEFITAADLDRYINAPETLKNILIKTCAYYLVLEKRKRKALDPVADFHLNNGARLEYINWLADVSENGMHQSAGMMVNYQYKLNDIQKNHEHYFTSGNIVTSVAINNLLKSFD